MNFGREGLLRPLPFVLGQVRQTQSRASFEVKTPRRISETPETAAASLCHGLTVKR
jgi:hypothetical protein